MNNPPDRSVIVIAAARENDPDDGIPTLAKAMVVAFWAFLVLFWSIVFGILSPLSLEVPARDTSVEGLLTILRSNFTLLAVLAACAALQRFARDEVQQGKQPWIRRITDLVVGLFITLNVAVVGFAIGQLGMDALIRIIPHGWLEVPAFAIGVYGYILARSRPLETRQAVRLFALAALLLLVAAPIEAFITGSI